MQTRKHPRTLHEAFGPYAHLAPVEDNDPPPIGEGVVTVVCLVVIFSLVALLVAKVL